MKIIVVGAGGTGSWLARALVMLVGDASRVVIYDGDSVEAKNLNRQIFGAEDIGRNKATALAAHLGCQARPEWFLANTAFRDVGPEDWVFGCTDTHSGRKEILTAVDQHGCKAIISGNEFTSAESYYYQPDWLGTRRDPRVFYPEILRANDDPRRRACTGLAAEETPQLVTANLMAASLAGWLYVLWAMKAPGLKQEVIETLPFHLRANLSAVEVFS